MAMENNKNIIQFKGSEGIHRTDERRPQETRNHRLKDYCQDQYWVNSDLKVLVKEKREYNHSRMADA